MTTIWRNFVIPILISYFLPHFRNMRINEVPFEKNRQISYYSRLPNSRNITINFLEKFVCCYELIREYYVYRFCGGAFLKFSNITNLNRDWCLSVRVIQKSGIRLSSLSQGDFFILISEWYIIFRSDEKPVGTSGLKMALFKEVFSCLWTPLARHMLDLWIKWWHSLFYMISHYFCWFPRCQFGKKLKKPLWKGPFLGRSCQLVFRRSEKWCTIPRSGWKTLPVTSWTGESQIFESP